jgi:nitroreductase
MSESKRAQPDHPVHELIARRWSPYAYASRAVDLTELRSLFEAARWAASSYNEQPWRYILATTADSVEFERLLSCLVEPNQAWAKYAPALALGVAGLEFSHNGKPNPVALHDLGLASANLVLEAAARGLYVHQMAGILPDRARELYGIPEKFDPLTALAIGYLDEGGAVPETFRERDRSPRSRKPLGELVFSGSWGNAALT